MYRDFSMQMEEEAYLGETVTKELVEEALDVVFEDAILGNYNFLIVENEKDNSFMQVTFEEGVYQIEYAKGDGIIYKADIDSESELQTLFFDYLDGHYIDTSTYLPY